MSTFKLIKEHLRMGAVTHHGGQAIEVLADAVGKSTKEVHRCLLRMHDNDEITLEPNKGFVMTISLKQGEVFFHTENGRRESKYATSATGQRYRGTLSDDQVGQLTVRRAGSCEEYIEMFGIEPPDGMFESEVKSTTTKEVKHVAHTPPVSSNGLRKNTRERMEMGQMVQLFLQQQFTGQPMSRNHAIEAAASELELTEHQVKERFVELERVELIASERMSFQGPLMITSVSERMLDEIDMKWLLKYHGKIKTLPRRDRIEVLLAAAKWAIARNGNQPFSMSRLIRKLGVDHASARRYSGELTASDAVLMAEDHGRVGRVYELGPNIDDPETVYNRVLVNDRQSINETLTPEPSLEESPEVVTTTFDGDVESIVIRKDVFDQLVERAKRVAQLEQQLVVYGDRLASQADLIAGREAILADMHELIAELNQRGSVKDLTSVSSVDDLLG